jgi:endonuclease/exonuclease/phosphatase (EEP) superfamily protein YafD
MLVLTALLGAACLAAAAFAVHAFSESHTEHSNATFWSPSNVSHAPSRSPGNHSTSRLRLLQLNVREGATDGRARGVAAVIKASGADVVTLDEVNVQDIFKQIAASVRFHSYFVPAKDGYNVGLLSRFPIKKCFNYADLIPHAAYACRIPIHGTNWWIFGTHFAPVQENEIVPAATLLLSKMKQHPTDPVVLSGDLNAQTPGENDRTPLLVIPLIKSAGYIDSFRELYTVQQNPGLTIHAPPYGQFERRLDYVFHNQKARAVSARVIHSVPGFIWPSDHAALAVTLTPTVAAG